MNKRNKNIYSASDLRSKKVNVRILDLRRAWNLFVRILIPVIWIYIAILLTIKL